MSYKKMTEILMNASGNAGRAGLLFAASTNVPSEVEDLLKIPSIPNCNTEYSKTEKASNITTLINEN